MGRKLRQLLLILGDAPAVYEVLHQAEQVVDFSHCIWFNFVVMPSFAAPLADQHLLHAAPQLLMLREETTVKDVHLVELFHLHSDRTLVSCQCVLFGNKNIPVLVLHAHLEEEPETEHVKTGFTLQHIQKF